MGLFPFKTKSNELESFNEKSPIFKEYAWDYYSGQHIFEKGKIKVVEKNEAIKVWIYKVLKTDRYKFLGYSWQYGHEFEQVIGKSMTDEEKKLKFQRLLEDCLLINPYIQSVSLENISVDEDDIKMDINVETIYGEVTINV